MIEDRNGYEFIIELKILTFTKVRISIWDKHGKRPRVISAAKSPIFMVSQRWMMARSVPSAVAASALMLSAYWSIHRNPPGGANIQVLVNWLAFVFSVYGGWINYYYYYKLGIKLCNELDKLRAYWKLRNLKISKITLSELRCRFNSPW